jgi:hypothetical protein
MLKKLLLALALVGIPCLAQTKILPDCAIPFSFTATGSTSNLTCGNNGLGISSWVFVYSSTGYSALSIVVQSAPDNHGVPGSWGTFGGTVLTSVQYPGSSGVNPNTATTSANTGLAGYFPWVRVTLSSVTGTGKVTGALYGYLNSTLAKAGGGGGAGTVTACGGATAGQVAAFSGPTAICGIVQSAFDAAAVNALVRLGPPDSSLPFFLPGYTFGQTLLVTQDHSSGNKAAIGVESHGTYGIFAVNITSTETSNGMETDAYTGTPGGLGYGAYHFIGSLDGSTPAGLYGVTAFPQIGDGSTGMPSVVPNLWGFYRYTPAFLSGSTLTTDQAFFAEPMGGKATNAYPLWSDEPGVYAIHAINTFNSVYQARPALYNPLFTKYTPGATNQERGVCQWQTNVYTCGTESGGTGTLRDFQLIGNRVLYKTAAPGTNTVEVASTQFVAAAVAAAVGPNLTSNAILKGQGTPVPAASGCTIDGSNNFACPGSITSGSGAGVAGTIDLTQGTLPSSFPANTFSLYSPTSIPTSYQWRMPTADPGAGAVVIDGGATPSNISTLPFQGNGGKVQKSTGSPVSGNCTKFDVNANTVDAGFPCGSGTGGTPSVSNINPITANANSTADQTLQELALTSAMLNTLGGPFLIHGAGTLTIRTLQTPTLTFKVKLCTVSGCGSGTVVTLGTTTTGATVAATANPWNINLKAVTNVIGASGTLITDGALVVDIGAVATLADTVYSYPPTTSSSIDLTGLLFIDFTVTSSTQPTTPFNSFTQSVATIEPASEQGPAGATGPAGPAGGGVTSGNYPAPATCTAGSSYFFRDTTQYTRADCTATNIETYFHNSAAMTLPPVCPGVGGSPFTWVNQNASGLCTTTQGALVLSTNVTAACCSNQLIMQTAPGTPYSIATELIYSGPSGNGGGTFGMNAGIAIRDSGTGKFSACEFYYSLANASFVNLQVRFEHWNSATSDNTTVQFVEITSSGVPPRLKFQDTGTNHVCYYSLDEGLHWGQVASESRTTFMATPNQVGLLQLNWGMLAVDVAYINFLDYTQGT